MKKKKKWLGRRRLYIQRDKCPVYLYKIIHRGLERRFIFEPWIEKYSKFHECVHVTSTNLSEDIYTYTINLNIHTHAHVLPLVRRRDGGQVGSVPN